MPKSDIPAMDFGEGGGGSDIPPMSFGDEAAPTSTRKPAEAPGLGDIAIRTGREGLALGDMVWNVIPQLIGAGAGMGMRARAIGQGKPREEQAQADLDARAIVMEKLGSPLAKLMQLAGMGDEGGAPTGIDSIMHKAANLLSKGGEWVEKATNGAILKGDVEALADTAMAAGGGRGVAAGLEKIVPGGMRVEATKMSGPALERARQDAMRRSDPPMIPELLDEPVQQAQAAIQAKTRLTPAKDLEFDPIAGTLKEKIPEMGEGLGTPEPAPGMERVYHGGEPGDAQGPLWFSRDKKYAEGYAKKSGARVWYVDVPKDYGLSPGDADYGVLPPTNLELPTEYASKRQLLAEPKVPTSLDTALDKMSAGKPWDLTAEERIALKGYGYAGEAGPQLVDEAGRPLSSQSGVVDPKLLARLAAIGLGAWAAQHYSNDHDLMDAVMGGIAGAALSSISPASAIARLKALRAPDPRIRINDPADWLEESKRLSTIDTWTLQKKVEGLVPKAEDRIKLNATIESGSLDDLTPKQREAAQLILGLYSDKLLQAVDTDTLRSAHNSYLAQQWDWSANSHAAYDAWRSGMSGEGMIPTIAEGKAAGLTPVTEDASAIMGMYGNALSNAIANSKFLDMLKSQDVGPDIPMKLVVPMREAPSSYVSIDHPQFMGLKVHPDIKPSLEMLFDTGSPGVAMKAIGAISDTTKRIAVSYSAFHLKALTDALIGGSSNPLRALAELPAFAKGTSLFLKELEKGSASQLVQRAVKGGLMFSLERTGAAVEDAGAGFYQSMKWLQGQADHALPGLGGKSVEALTEVNHKVDTFTWARMHAGMKLMVFSEKYSQLMQNSARLAAKGAGRALTEVEASKIAASYTDDLFGGLNWRRIAEGASTRWGRTIAMAALNPASRRAMQILMFAPDWTISTTRAAVKAFSGRPDFIRPTTLAGLHQQYLLRSALYYLTVGDAINYTMSGHHVWENKDPTFLDMDPKGYHKMQWSKHTMEPVHWIEKPGQQALNKLGMIPKEAATQALGVDHLSAKGTSPPIGNRAKHLARNFLPIAAQQGMKGGTAGAVSGALGVPIYGKTPQERELERQLRKMAKQRRAAP